MMTSSRSNMHWHTCIHTLTYTRSNLALQRHRDRGSCYLSWVGVCWKMCFSYSLSHQPQQTGLLSVQLSTGARDNRLSALSSFHLSLCPSSPLFPRSPSMHLFYCLPQFPACNNRYFSFSPLLLFLVDSFTSPLSLVPPLLLACFSFFSLPHFLCALQWFFRFFPAYCLPLFFPDSFHPTLCLFSFLNLSLPYR